MGPSNRCRRGAGVCMEGQIPCRQCTKVPGPSVRHRGGPDEHKRETGGEKGRGIKG